MHSGSEPGVDSDQVVARLAVEVPVHAVEGLVVLPVEQVVDGQCELPVRVELITDFLNEYDALKKRNSNVTDITRSFASNAL